MTINMLTPRNQRFDYKSMTIEELRSIFSSINWKLEPRLHQYISMAFAADGRNRVNYFHDVGTGKTPLSIVTMYYLWGCKSILVTCPSSAFGAWEKDIPLFTNYSYDFLTGSGDERKAILRDHDKHVWIINYEGLKTIYAKLIKKSKSGNGGGWHLDMSQFDRRWDGLIFDEIHKLKDYKSLQSKIALQLSMRTKHVIGLTGTPIDSSLLEAHNIMKIIDLGASLGPDFFMFQKKYFVKNGFDWVLKCGAREEILQKIGHTSIAFAADECYDLPKVQEHVISVHPGAEYFKIMKQIQKGIIRHKGKVTPLLDKDGNVSPQKQLEACRQLAAGFYYAGPKGTDPVRLSQQPKAETVVDKIQDTGCKIILFFHYREEQYIYEQAMNKANIGFLSMHGGQDPKERMRFERMFHTNPEYRIIIAQKSVANEGFDGTAASIIIHTTPCGSPKIRKQCRGRIRRANQTDGNLNEYDLSLVGSVDENILKKRGPRFKFVKDCLEFLKAGRP